MPSHTNSIRRLIIATAFASGLVSVGVAASAQTTAVPQPAASTNTVAMSTHLTTANQPTDAWTQPAKWSDLQALLGGGL
jgi:hypothetical protein